MTEQQDRFPEFLRQAARWYHQPPTTPGDAMWAGIAEQRRGRAAEAAARGRWLRWASGIAAVLVLGIAIGRWTVPARVPSGAIVQSGQSGGLAYQAVAGDHFGRAEALLTAFRVEARTGRRDEQLPAAARSLLVTNRLLLDSPLATDARMRNLLEDLELVLVQIGQLASEQGVDPTDLIVQALEDNSVLLRLRTAVPAGSAAARAQGAL